VASWGKAAVKNLCGTSNARRSVAKRTLGIRTRAIHGVVEAADHRMASVRACSRNRHCQIVSVTVTKSHMYGDKIDVLLFCTNSMIQRRSINAFAFLQILNLCGTTRTCWRMDANIETPRTRSSNDETIMEEKSNDGLAMWMNVMEKSNTECPGTKMEGGGVNSSAISHCSDDNNIIFCVF
jgi:hypothetical protein